MPLPLIGLTKKIRSLKEIGSCVLSSQKDFKMPKAVIENTEVYQLKSDIVGDIFEITVLEQEDDSNEPLPVIYLTDANNSLGTGCDAANLLMLGGEIPQALLVGIGYPLEGF